MNRLFGSPFRTLLIAGVALIVAGALWGTFLVGVPYQDPTPQQSAREALHLGVSSWLVGLGAGLATIGALGIVTRRVTGRGTARRRR